MTESVLDPMPDMELIGHPLEMGRPELRELMDRYTPRTTAGVLRMPAALVVSDRPGDDVPVRAALEDEGWRVQSCAGPANGDCPMLRGRPCSLRASVDAAVVFVDPKRCGGGLGTVTRLRCAADGASPGVVVVKGTLAAPQVEGRTAWVGSLRGPEGVLEAISKVVSQND